MHPEIVGGPNPDSISCDEVPFASTYESPGTPAANGGQMLAGRAGGGECIQTVAAKVDDGSEHLLGGTRYDVSLSMRRVAGVDVLERQLRSDESGHLL